MKDINSTIDQQIESYLNGELHGNDLKSIKEMIQNHANIAEEILFRKSFRFVVEHKDDFQFKNKISQVMNTTTIEPDLSTNGFNGMSWLKIIGISIGVIAFSVLSWFAITDNQQQTINTILEKHLEPFENNIQDDSDNNLGRGLTAYDNKEYDVAAEQLQLYTDALPIDTVPQFYLGLSYLLNNQPKEAIPYLQNINNSSEDFMIPHAQWYLGLTYLKMNDIDKMTESFEPIKNNSMYQEKISAILTELF